MTVEPEAPTDDDDTQDDINDPNQVEWRAGFIRAILISPLARPALRLVEDRAVAFDGSPFEPMSEFEAETRIKILWPTLMGLSVLHIYSG